MFYIEEQGKGGIYYAGEGDVYVMGVDVRLLRKGDAKQSEILLGKYASAEDAKMVVEKIKYAILGCNQKNKDKIFTGIANRIFVMPPAEQISQERKEKEQEG